MSQREDSPWARPTTPAVEGPPAGPAGPAGPAAEPSTPAPPDPARPARPVGDAHRSEPDDGLDPVTRREAERWRERARATADPRWARPEPRCPPGAGPGQAAPAPRSEPSSPARAGAHPEWTDPLEDDARTFRWGAAAPPDAPSLPDGRAGPGPNGPRAPAETVPGETVPGETVPGETVPAETVPAETAARAARRVAAALAVVAGGLVTVIAAFLTWTTVGVLDITEFTVRGTDADQDGNATFALGALAALAGLYALRRRASARVWLVSGTAGAMVVLLAIVEIIRDGRADLGGGSSGAGLALDVSVTVGPGLWLTLAGGLAVLLATVIGGIARPGRSRPSGRPGRPGHPARPGADRDDASATPSLGS